MGVTSFLRRQSSAICREWMQGQRDNGGTLTCAYCGVVCCNKKGRDNTATVDHKMPRSRGGTDQPENLCVCCIKCNRAKGNMTADEFTKKPQTARARWVVMKRGADKQ